MEHKPSYDITDCGDELQVAFFIDHVQVAGAVIPLEIGDDQAMILAQVFGESFIASARPRSVGLS